MTTCILPDITKIIAITMLIHIKEYLKSLIGRKQAGFRFGFAGVDHTYALSISVQRSSLSREGVTGMLCMRVVL